MACVVLIGLYFASCGVITDYLENPPPDTSVNKSLPKSIREFSKHASLFLNTSITSGKKTTDDAFFGFISAAKVGPYCRSTVVSAYCKPGYKPNSASVPLAKFPDDFHSEVSLCSPTGYKTKPPLVPPQKLPQSPLVRPWLVENCLIISVNCHV